MIAVLNYSFFNLPSFSSIVIYITKKQNCYRIQKSLQYATV